MRGIPSTLRCKVSFPMWREKGALRVERFAVFSPSIPHPLLCTLNQCNRCLSSRVRGSSWLGCQVLPAYGAVFILELAATSGCSRMSHAPNLALNYKLGSKMFLHNFKKMTQSVLFGWQPSKERKTNELSSESVPEVKVCTEGRLLRDEDQSSDLPLQKDDWISSFTR